MNQNFKSNERELVKVATFFKRQSRKLIDAGKLGAEHAQVAEAVDRFVAQMEEHANIRARIQEERETLKKLVKDHAVCPRCRTSDKLKLTGTEKDNHGWTSNRYKCRKCNIQFTWNRPNNPWDMVAYIESVIAEFEVRLASEGVAQTEREQLANGVASMKANLDQLKPVIEAHDHEFGKLKERDLEMEKIIHEFKNSLLIEKIKMNTWENKNS
jgi:hypothetical protein